MSANIPNIRTDLEIEFVDSQPIVGVLIPLYNHGKYLPTAVDSAVSQNYQNKLIIIIDDKSTDNSVEIAQSLFTNIKQQLLDDDSALITVGDIQGVQSVLILQPENKKQTVARNKGITTTWHYCDYYCQLDADDEYMPNKLSKCMEVATTDVDQIGIVYHDVIIQNKLTNIVTHEFREPYSIERCLQECIICNTMLINKKALEDAGLYDENMSVAEDWDIQLRICKNWMAYHIPEPLSIYNVVESSCTFTVDKQRWQECWQKIHERHRQNA